VGDIELRTTKRAPFAPEDRAERSMAVGFGAANGATDVPAGKIRAGRKDGDNNQQAQFHQEEARDENAAMFGRVERVHGVDECSTATRLKL
jgi:hypothetical protein